MINLIVARSRNNVIGNAGGIPWKVKGEQKQFKELTTGNAVIMGRKTYEDIGRPLPDRLNIVVSNTANYEQENLMTARSLEKAISLVPEGMEVYISGGARLYMEAIPIVDRMYITEIGIDVPVDDTAVFFPRFRYDEFKKTVGETVQGDIPYTRTVYVRR